MDAHMSKNLLSNANVPSDDLLTVEELTALEAEVQKEIDKEYKNKA